MANFAQAESPVSAGKDLPAYLPLFTLPTAAILLSGDVPPWAFMWALSFGIFAGLKSDDLVEGAPVRRWKVGGDP